jgi:hypothetical protein
MWIDVGYVLIYGPFSGLYRSVAGVERKEKETEESERKRRKRNEGEEQEGEGRGRRGDKGKKYCA